MAYENKPKKGILKTSSSFDKDGHHDSSNKQAKWDEMNILATFHPPDKDYGHIKIDEPPTPYNSEKGEDMEDDSEEEKSSLDPENLANRLMDTGGPKVLEEPEESSDDDSNETEEEREKKRAFEQKRKLHYNEFQAVKLARQLLEDEEDDEREDEDEKNVTEESELTNL